MKLSPFILCGGLFVSLAVLGAESIKVSGPIMQLPPMVVTSSQGLTWRYAEMPGYEILSCCSDSMTSDFMHGLARAETLLRLLVPKEYWAKSDVPRVIILSIPANLALMPRELIGGDNDNHNLTYQNDKWNINGSQIIPNIELGDQDCSIVFATLEDMNSGQESFIIHPAHVSVLLTTRRPSWPPWLVAGVANLYTGLYRATLEDSVEFHEKDTFSIPALEWISAELTTALIKEQSRRKSGETRAAQENELKRFIPLQLMLTQQPSPESAEWPKWNAQATLFVRWALSSESPSRKEAFWRFAARTANGEPATENMFRETFGYGYDQALVELNEYLRVAIKRPIDLHLPKTGSAITDIRSATDTEILRIKEDWTRLVAAYLRTRSFDAKLLDNRHRAAMRACEKGNRDPRLLAAVGLFESDMEHDSSARVFLEAAIESKVVRPRAYYELARLRYAMVKNFDGSTLSAVQAERAVAPLLLGVGQSPSLKDSYSLAAKICLNSEIVLTPEKLQLLNRGLELFPDDMDLLYNFALLNDRQGSNEEAMRLAERGLTLSNYPEMRAKFEQLRSK